MFSRETLETLGFIEVFKQMFKDLSLKVRECKSQRQVRQELTLILDVPVIIKPMVPAPIFTPCVHHLFSAFCSV